MESISAIRWRRWRREFGPIFVRGVFSPFTDPASSFQFLLLVVVVAVTYVFYPGLLRIERMSADDKTRWAIWVIALILGAIPLWMLIQLVLTPFKLRNIEKEKGVWVDRTFLYYEPPLVSMSLFRHEDNGKAAIITFDDAEPNSLVRWEIAIEGPTNRTAARMNPMGYGDVLQQAGLPRPVGNSSGGIRIDQNRQAMLIAETLEGSDPAIIRVRMRSFEV